MPRTPGAKNKKPAKSSLPKAPEDYKRLRQECYLLAAQAPCGYKDFSELIKNADLLFRFLLYGGAGAGAYLNHIVEKVKSPPPIATTDVTTGAIPTPDDQPRPFLSKFEQTHTM